MNRCVYRLALLLFLGSGIVACAEERPATGFPPSSPELVRLVKSLLDDGLAEGTKRLPAALHQIAAARKLAEDDSRLEYAHGLVLLKHGRTKSAIAQFESAVNTTGPAYWPAWQALIWTELTEQQYEKGLDLIETFALLVRNSNPDPEATDPQRDAVRWMGQVFEALEITATAKPTRAIVARHSARVSESLGGAFRSELAIGREMVRERNRHLADKSAAELNAAEERRSAQRNDQDKKLDSNLKQQREKRENVAKGVEEQKEALKGSLADADKQLATLEKEYQRFEKRADSLQQSIIMVGREITIIEFQMNAPLAQRGMLIAQMQGMLPQQQLWRRQNDMLSYQLEYNAVAFQMAEMAAQGRRMIQERNAMEQERANATGELIQRNSELETWTKRTEEKRKRLEIQSDAKVQKAKASADRKLLSLKTYVTLDLETERAHLLQAFGYQPKVPAEPESSH